jgi:hypothetical protein
VVCTSNTHVCNYITGKSKEIKGKHPCNALVTSFRHSCNTGKSKEIKGNRKADPADKFQVGTVIPGELLSYQVRWCFMTVTIPNALASLL